ncbi:MAG: hypothetical protein IKG67_10175 [Parasporobacterium sp.]|nr:hypothetical protein [Parasporobacterium sp.]
MEKKRRFRRKKLSEVSLEHDIRYRGPLSYRHLRMFGWLCIVIAQVSLLLTLGGNISDQLQEQTMTLQTVLSVVASMSVPFLLLANYALILDTSDGYKRQFTIHIAATALIVVLSLFILNRYAVGTVAVLTGSRQTAIEQINLAVHSTKSGSVSFNLFIDLLLCTLFMYCLNARPKRFFQGKKIRILRAMAVLPVLYEAASIALRILAAQDKIVLDYNIFPFLTTKPPMMFLVFLVLAFFIKYRERSFCKNGRTHAEYDLFLKTRRNSLQFSVFTAIVFAVAGVLDSMILGFLANALLAHQSANGDLIFKMLDLGIGGAGILLPMAPVVLLFSYTRTHKNQLMDYLIPVMGVLLSIFVYLEGAYQAVQRIPNFLEGFLGGA